MTTTAPKPSSFMAVEHQEVIRVLEHIDTNRSLFEGLEDLVAKRGPKFATTVVARVFFQRTSHWFRWREQQGQFVGPDGRTVDPERSDNGTKLYSLADIERLAYILHENGALPISRLFICLHLIRLIGIGYEVIPVVSN